MSRELRCNLCGNTYNAGHAQQLAAQRRRQRPVSRKMGHLQLNAAVRRGLAQDLSPDKSADRLRAKHPHAITHLLSKENTQS